MSTIRKIYRGFMFGLAVGTGALLVVVTFLVLLAAAVRYLGLSPGSLHWVSEMTTISIIWLVMLGGALAHDRGAHVGIEIPERVPARIRRPMAMCGTLFGGLFLVALTIAGLELTGRTMSQRTPALGMPVGLAYLALPVGAIIMLAQSLLFFFAPGLRAGQDPMGSAAGSGP